MKGNIMAKTKLNEKVAFTLVEGATHVGMYHNIGKTLNGLVKSATHVENCHNTRRVAFTLAEGATHVGIFHITRRVAFTLAEVLITLGIIGIVAALTIPTLVKNYQEKVTVTKVKQAYSMLSQAFLLAVNENGPVVSWDLGTSINDPQSHINLANYFKAHLRLNKDCIGKSDNYTYKNCTHSTVNANRTSYANVVLSNGMLASFRLIYADCVDKYNNFGSNVCALVSIGQYPYDSGKTSFSFYITPNGIIPAGEPKKSNQTLHTFKRYCDPSITDPVSFLNPMSACTAWVVYNGNMDYLRCFDKLSWDGAHSCKEAEQIVGQ